MLVDWLILGTISIVGVALHKNITKARYAVEKVQHDILDYRIDHLDYLRRILDDVEDIKLK